MADTSNSNPFTQLDLPIQFDLDASTIERAYLTKLASAHPDVGGDMGGADDSQHDAAGFNAARATLLDAERRANALLAVLAGPSASDCKDLPDGFLMEMMTRREEIEEQIGQAGDQAGDRARASWESWAHDERVAYTSLVSGKFGSLPADESSTDRVLILRQIRVSLNAWRYIERLIEQLDPEYDPASADFR